MLFLLDIPVWRRFLDANDPRALSSRGPDHDNADPARGPPAGSASTPTSLATAPWVVLAATVTRRLHGRRLLEKDGHIELGVGVDRSLGYQQVQDLVV